MKKQLIFMAIILCAGLQSNLSMCGEKPALVRLREWLASFLPSTSLSTSKEDANMFTNPLSGKKYKDVNKYATSIDYEKSTGMHKEKQRLMKGGLAFAGGLSAGILSLEDSDRIDMLRKALGYSYSDTRAIDMITAGYGIAIGSLFLVAIMAYLDVVIYDVNQRERSKIIAEIKEVIRAYINNPLLYPTRSSKIHALLKKEDFLQYVDLYARDINTGLDDACTSLSEEISKAPYSDQAKEEDRAVDAELSLLRNEFRQSDNSIENINVQIKALEMMVKKGGSIAEVRAYLSFYYRLLNKREIEKLLTQEQKDLRDSWKNKAKAITQEELQKAAII